MAPAPFKLAETAGELVVEGAAVVVGGRVVEGGAVVVCGGLVGVGVGVVVAQPARMRLARISMETVTKNHFLVRFFNKFFSPFPILDGVSFPVHSFGSSKPG